MDSYIDITVLPDLEFNGPQLLNAVFAKLHRALAQLGTGSVGVSFPDVDKTLGNCLRLHGTKDALQTLAQINWLQGLKDYIEITEILNVPANTKFRTVRRIQVKSSVERLRRRSVSRGRLTYEQAIVRIPDEVEKRSKLPFVQLRSLSNGQTFKIFVEHGPLINASVTGYFSFYGLSAEATIPWF
ncbi:type I-F CRISPR-associated endoribonuclease Cas6/Csy4 [Biostraticola tofi]|uniref:CRISPR-associated Csy4 family protein n=1 Tax=Biostraticola tofi TaxID=466109 RepID=A0A4R3YL89_9GAMM|nr:type I-F CRISPR-associated endoribonuclease Cas6/Csy4 [Biostraticola tofi]TCV91563.1 CRISPR-associated Csy4 family protein [Biostraticola tofi]